MRIACVLLAWFALGVLESALAKELRISHQWPPEIDARDRAVRVFVKEAQARVPGFSFRIHPQLSLNIKAEDQFAALRSGALEMSVYPLPYVVKSIPEFSLAALPGLFRSVEAARSLKGSKISDQIQAIANAHGAHIVAWWWVPGGFVTRNREIAGPETVKGLRLRGGDPLFDLMLKEAGAQPVELTSNELYTAMKTGALDGALTSYETFVSTKLYEHAKHFTAGSPGIWMFATPLVIAKSVWDGMSATEQQAFEEAAEISEEYFASTQAEAEQKFIVTFTRAGAKFHQFTYDEYLAWLRLAQQTAWRQYLAISPAAESLLREIVETLLDSTRSR